MNRVFQHVNGKEIMICGQRPAGFVYAQVHKNNQQTTGRALGKGSGPLPQSSTVTSKLDDDANCLVSTEIGQSGTNLPSI